MKWLIVWSGYQAMGQLPYIITMGLTYGHDFHFLPSDPLNFIKLSITMSRN
jgi:hypothetical protein